MAATAFLLAQQLRSQNRHGYCHPVDNTQPKFVLHGGDPGRMRGKGDMTTATEKAGRAHDVGVETLRSLGLHKLQPPPKQQVLGDAVATP